jgi:hypothetical protein
MSTNLAQCQNCVRIDTSCGFDTIYATFLALENLKTLKSIIKTRKISDKYKA